MRRFAFNLFAVAGSSLGLLALGCTSESTPAGGGGAVAEVHKEGDGHDHGHAEEGPHHGLLIELGEEEYHAELTHDDATQTVTIYVLDGAAKQAVPIDAKEVTINLVVGGKPLQVALAAGPQEGDPAGKSSKFQVVSPELGEGLDAPENNARLSLTIADKPYTGTIAAHEHGEGEHKHK